MKKTNFTIGHIIIKVVNLKEAVKQYEQKGFQVCYGTNPKRASNAMIYLEDNSFLELSTVIPSGIKPVANFILHIVQLFARPLALRFRKYVNAPKGFMDYALDSSPRSMAKENMKILRQQDLNISRGYSFRRIDLRNIKLEWKLYLPEDRELPFFMGEYIPDPGIRPEQKRHQNGVAGIQTLQIGVKDLVMKANIYDKILGLGEWEEDHTKRRYFLEDQEILLVQADEDRILGISAYTQNEQIYHLHTN